MEAISDLESLAYSHPLLFSRFDLRCESFSEVGLASPRPSLSRKLLVLLKELQELSELKYV